MKRIALVFSVLSLSACGTSQGELAEFEPETCDAVTAIMQAGQAAEPYSALRGEPEMLGDMPIEDSWSANQSAFGEGCETAVLRDFFDMDVFTYSCPLYAERSNLDRETHEVEARAAAQGALEIISACLGEDWIVEETTQNPDYQVFHKYLLEPAYGRPGADTFDFTVDPIYIELSYTPFMRGRGGPAGWQVYVQFQEQRLLKIDIASNYQNAGERRTSAV